VDRLTADDYFREALVVLGEQGSDGLTIAVLCDRLSVTKGSFYHHFASTAGFVAALLQFWEREHSERLIAMSRAQPDPTLRMATLTEFAVQLPHASEAAIRSWARSSPPVAEVVVRVDKRRERHLIDAAVALGIERGRARLLSRLALNLLVGVQLREAPVDLKRLRQMLEEINRLVFLDADPRLVARLLEVTRS
jgi:AcrR family transcriptional regulator